MGIASSYIVLSGDLPACGSLTGTAGLVLTLPSHLRKCWASLPRLTRLTGGAAGPADPLCSKRSSGSDDTTYYARSGGSGIAARRPSAGSFDEDGEAPLRDIARPVVGQASRIMSLDSPYELTVDIGGVVILIGAPYVSWRDALVSRFSTFVSSSPPSWRVEIHHRAAPDGEGAQWIVHEGPRSRFRVSTYSGRVDLERCHAAIDAASEDHVFSAVDRILAYICMLVLPRQYDGLLLHAAGVVMDGVGHAFFGPSGAGKTTIASLVAGHAELLTDENVIVRMSGAGVDLLSTPFWGHSTPSHLVSRTNRRVPLGGLYALIQAPHFALTRLDPAQAIVALLGTEKVAIERVESASAWLTTAERLIDRVSVQSLAFRPTSDLWQFLRSSSSRP